MNMSDIGTESPSLSKDEKIAALLELDDDLSQQLGVILDQPESKLRTEAIDNIYRRQNAIGVKVRTLYESNQA